METDLRQIELTEILPQCQECGFPRERIDHPNAQESECA
jgi:hypothetical protein